MIFVETSYCTLRAFLLIFFRSIPKTSILFNPSAYCGFARLRKIETAAGLRTIYACGKMPNEALEQ